MRTYFAIVVFILGFGCLQGCGGSGQTSVFQSQMDTLGVTINQVRIGNLHKSIKIGNLVEQAADSIRAGSQDPMVRENALVWKMSVIPDFRRVLLYSDPVAAALDGQAFAVQMRHYLDGGPGNSLFGERQQIAVRAARTVESLFTSFTDTTGSVELKEGVNREVEEWAREHPIDNRTFDRESVVPYLTKLRIGYVPSLPRTAGDIAENVSNISNHLNLYAAQVPREARWQAEYLIDDMELVPRMDSLQREADRALASVDSLMRLIASGAVTIDIPALKSLHDDIVLLERMISAEREIVLADVERQRVVTLQEVERYGDVLLEKTSGQAVVIVDHLMLRVAQLAALLVIVIILSGLIVFRVLRRKSSIPQ
jgi:hypothetical protein